LDKATRNGEIAMTKISNIHESKVAELIEKLSAEIKLAMAPEKEPYGSSSLHRKAKRTVTLRLLKAL
jgi:hypothetical protein